MASCVQIVGTPIRQILISAKNVGSIFSLRICPICTHANQPDFRFCEECGHAFEEQALEPEPASAFFQKP